MSAHDTSTVIPEKSPIYKEKDLLGGGGSSDPAPAPPAPMKDPQLDMLWTTPPEFIPTSGTSSGGDGTTPAPPAPCKQFTIGLSSLRTFEQDLLNVSSPLVVLYNDLRSQVGTIAGSSTFWGQRATVTKRLPDHVGRPGWSVVVLDDPGVQSAAEKFAPVIGPEMTRALRQVADAMEVVGTYIGHLNIAGQAYASADYNSILPDVTPPPS